MLWIFILIAALWLLYKWLTSDHDYFAKAGVPFEKPVPIFGNLYGCLTQKESMIDVAQRGYNKFKHAK